MSNKEIIEKVNQTFSENNIEGFLDYCADNIKWNMIGSPIVVGKDAIRKSMESMDFEGNPNIIVDNVIGEGDTVVVEGTMDLKKKSGEPYHAAYCDVYHLDNGKIVEMHSYVQELAPSE